MNTQQQAEEANYAANTWSASIPLHQWIEMDKREAFTAGYLKAANSRQAEIDGLKAMVADSLDFLDDLLGEWKWKDGTTKSNQRMYDELKALVGRIDEYQTNSPAHSAQKR